MYVQEISECKVHESEYDFFLILRVFRLVSDRLSESNPCEWFALTNGIEARDSRVTCGRC